MSKNTNETTLQRLSHYKSAAVAVDLHVYSP